MKYAQDEGVDWGALTKGWANYMAEDVFRLDACLFCASLQPGPYSAWEKGKLFQLPDWAGYIMGSDEVIFFRF